MHPSVSPPACISVWVQVNASVAQAQYLADQNFTTTDSTVWDRLPSIAQPVLLLDGSLVGALPQWVPCHSFAHSCGTAASAQCCGGRPVPGATRSACTPRFKRQHLILKEQLLLVWLNRRS